MPFWSVAAVSALTDGKKRNRFLLNPLRCIFGGSREVELGSDVVMCPRDGAFLS